MRVPAATLALPLLAGAAGGVRLSETTPDHLIVASAAAAVLCLIAGLGFLADDQPVAVILCAMTGSLCAGYSTGTSTSRALLAPPLLRWFETLAAPDTEPVLVEGVLRDDAALMPYGVVITVDVRIVERVSGRRERTAGGVRLVVTGSLSFRDVGQWRAGRTVRAPALLRVPTVFADPGVPDERRGLALRGVALTGSVKSASLVEVTAPGSWLSEQAARARAWTRRTIDHHVGSRDRRSAAVATAILIGDRTGLSDDDERRLQDAGTYHVIAISGGNIAILTTLLVMGARLLFVPFRAGAAACLALLLFYAEVAGGAASVGRAVTAASLFLAAQILDHRGAPLNVLAVAAVLAVGLRPATTLDGGFLLSFGATAGIVLGVPRLVRLPAGPRGTTLRRVARGAGMLVVGLAAATFCADVALAPISASLFSRVTFAGLVLNFVAIPLMTAIQCGAMALLLVAGLGLPGAAALGGFVHASAWALVESSRVVEAVPWVVRDVAPPAAWLCLLYYAAAGMLVVGGALCRPAAATLMLTGSLLVAGVFPARSGVPKRMDGVLRVVSLDVGQGDATLVVLPDGRALLVDAGGLAGTTFDIGGRVVVPALRALGVVRLHAMVLTHGDPDHALGAEAVMRRFAVANIWEGVPVPPHPILRALRGLAADRHVVWRTVRPGDVERAAGVDVRVLHPGAPDWERQRVRNDDSVVIELRYGRVSILLPGDIGREVEAGLIPSLDLAPVVILKAAHHGSVTSSSEAFVAAVDPRAVIFSAGRNNRFGHPAKPVVDRFASRAVTAFNTAIDGAVFVETDGDAVEVRGWASGRSFSVPGVKHRN